MDVQYQLIKNMKTTQKSQIDLVFDKLGNRLVVRKQFMATIEVYSKLLSLPHKYLPKIYDVKYENGKTYVIEEYIEGASIGTIRIGERQISKWFLELCEVLQFLHNHNILHRDIKPSNMLLGEDGHIRLIDFDAARQVKEMSESDTILLGTRGYAPPEQYGFSQTDIRADIYALGVTLKELLGKRAEYKIYRGIIRKCTEFNPRKRFANVGALALAWKSKRYKQLAPYFFVGFILLGIGMEIWLNNLYKGFRDFEKELLFYTDHSDANYMITNVGELRNGEEKILQMMIDLNGDGYKETIQMYAETEDKINIVLITGRPLGGQEVCRAYEYMIWIEKYLPLEYYLFTQSEDNLASDHLRDDYHIQVTCVNLDGKNSWDEGKEIVISIGDKVDNLITVIYNYDETSMEVTAERGFMWGSDHVIHNSDGTLESHISLYDFEYLNRYLYSKQYGVQNISIDITYEKYRDSLIGERTFEEILLEDFINGGL
ncbi:MAG: serine/threonine-protein kinase [Eubacteriales bacterium]